MRKTVLMLISLSLLTLAACAPLTTPAPTTLPATQPPPVVDTPTSTPVQPTEAQPAPASKVYRSSAFGLGFAFPAGWFGPDEYASDGTLRVAVGSDVVYPYGTGLEEQIYNLKNSYYVTVQYSKNDQNTFWRETYDTLMAMQDGESRSDLRSMLIRVRQLSLGGFEGIEYISTLSETAQTESVYIRQVLLFDDQSNLISVMGSPNNVEVDPAADWRAAYQAVDQQNAEAFQQIVESITLE